jgi:hypothetical protein
MIALSWAVAKDRIDHLQRDSECRACTSLCTCCCKYVSWCSCDHQRQASVFVILCNSVFLVCTLFGFTR